LFLGDILS